MNLLRAYHATMRFLRSRKQAYELTFGTAAGEAVLHDLARFCRAGQTTFHTDPHIHAGLEGRRQVWLRIAQHLNHTPDELYKLYGGPALNLDQLERDYAHSRTDEPDDL